jgi:hypothetical protein
VTLFADLDDSHHDTVRVLRMTFDYLDFELTVGLGRRGEYPVGVTSAPAGDARGIFRLDPASDDFQAILHRLEGGDTDDEFLMDLGRRLFDGIFAGDIATIFRASLGQARGQRKGLRVRLCLEPPELAALPWEYLYDASEDRFLSISPETPLVRYVPMYGSARPIATSLPLRVLVVIANPRDVTPLDVEQEREIIEEALTEVSQRLVHLQFVDRAVVAEINQAMRDFRPHVFHFIGHGQYRNNEASVILEDNDGHAYPVGERAFREFFQGISDTRLVVLNACQTATTSSTKPLAGISSRILQRRLPAVVAMQYPISDSAAIVFSREFYRSLALGYPVDAAISEARKGIFQEIGYKVRDWGIPVLFLRAQDGKLFELELPPSPPPPTIDLPPLVKLFFNLLIGVILTFIFDGRVSLACVSPHVTASSLAVVLLLLFHLVWRYLGPVIRGFGGPIEVAGIVTLPIRALALLIDALHPRRLPNWALWVLTTVLFLAAVILNLSPLSPFRTRDTPPIIENFVVRYTDGQTETFSAGRLVEVSAYTPVLIEATISDSDDVSCAWSTVKGTQQPAKGCAMRYSPPLEGNRDALSVLVQSPCAAQQTFAGLSTEVIQIGP